MQGPTSTPPKVEIIKVHASGVGGKPKNVKCCRSNYFPIRHHATQLSSGISWELSIQRQHICEINVIKYFSLRSPAQKTLDRKQFFYWKNGMKFRKIWKIYSMINVLVNFSHNKHENININTCIFNQTYFSSVAPVNLRSLSDWKSITEFRQNMRHLHSLKRCNLNTQKHESEQKIIKCWIINAIWIHVWFINAVFTLFEFAALDE